MHPSIGSLIARNRQHLVADLAGVLALVGMLVMGLHLPLLL